MRRAAAPIALALALLATAGGSSATPILDVWTPHGPAGPLIVALAASPDGPGTVYASSETNVWKSTDSGNTWSPTGDGPTNFAVSLVADPADVDRLIAGTSDGAIWVTSDGGDHWAPPSSGFSGSFWPLLSWTAAGLFALVDGALYTSADGGQIWTAAGTPPDGGARSLLVVSADAIYVGTELGTIQFSYDGGDNWIDRHDGIPTQIEPGSPYPPSIERLAVDPADAQTLYAEVNPLGVYRSTDGGVNWEEVVTPRPGHALTRVATLATTPTTVLAVVGTDVVSSTDGGATWSVAAESPKSAGGGMDSEFFGDPSNPGTVYAGGFGVYRSTDAGGTFALTSGGMGGTLVESLAAVPGVEGQYLAGTWEGVFRSDDDAGTWQHASDGMFGQALDIAADPTDSDRFYLVAAGDLWVTSDGAATWDPSSLTVPEVVYAVDASANSVLVGASTTIHRSTDGGESWSSTDLPLIHDSVNDVAIDPNDIEHVYAGTTDGLFRSVDGGANWTKIDSRHISAVSIAPDSVVYVLAEGAVDAFTPGGDSLVVASAGLSTYAYSLETDPTDADTVYAGTQQGAYKTADGGQHWVKLATAGMVSPFVSDILVPAPGHLLVATSKGTASIELSSLSAGVDPATNVTAHEADLAGAANPAGSSASVFFEYGTSSAYGNTTSVTPIGSGTDDVPVAATLTGLAHATTYHYRLVVQTSNGISASSDETFTTDFVAPTATTSPASQLGANGARLNGSVNPQGAATSYWFEYGLDTNYGSQTAETDAGAGKAAVSVLADLTGLDPGTTYHFRAVAENAKGTALGVDRQFTTASVPPSVTEVGPVTLRSADLEGGAVPLHVAWSATPGSKSICDYQVEIRSDLNGSNQLGLYAATELDGGSAPSDGVHYGVRARDCDTLAGDLTLGPPTDLLFFEESAPVVSRGVGWSKLMSADASGHRILRTTTPGSSLTFKFTGRSVALVAPKGPHYGAISVSLDAGPAVRVPLYQSSRSVQQLAYVLNLPSAAKHKLTITARGDAGRLRVDVDAFTTLRD